MGMSIQVKGIQQTQMFLKNASAIKLTRINDTIHNQGFKLQAEVQESIAGRRSERTSVDTGQFLNSIRTDNTQKLVSSVSSYVEYAQYLEKGTRYIAARKHFEMSKDRKKGSIILAVQQAVK